jgi:hypothetical protein
LGEIVYLTLLTLSNGTITKTAEGQVRTEQVVILAMVMLLVGLFRHGKEGRGAGVAATRIP